MWTHLRTGAIMLVMLTLLTGVIYPLAITVVAQAVFPAQANGSLILKDGAPVGSTLIGQPFDNPRYFWSRPSATASVGYNAGASSGSNLGPSNPALVTAVQARVDALRAADPSATGPVPVDLVTASGSGLDPDISPAAALYQVHRVALARGLTEDVVRGLVEQHISPPTLGILGEARVNVLDLNLALDELK